MLLYIFGNNALAKLLEYYLMEEGVNIEGLTLNERYIKENDTSLLPIEKEIENYGAENIGVYVATAYAHMNEDRKQVFKFLDEKNVKIMSYFHPTSVTASNVSIGRGSILLENSVIQPFVKIGDGNIIWNNSTISHHCQIGSFNYFSPGTVVSGRVDIKDNCFLGSNSTIRNDISIGNRVLIGAGEYVNRPIPSDSVYFRGGGS